MIATDADLAINTDMQRVVQVGSMVHTVRTGTLAADAQRSRELAAGAK